MQLYSVALNHPNMTNMHTPMYRKRLDSNTTSPVLSRTTSDGYLCADVQSSRDYEEHLYVNTQTLDCMDSLAQGPNGHKGPDSPQKDIFDMRKFHRRP